MTRKIFGYLSIALCGLAGPLLAETIYVPVVATEVGGVAYETRVMISNTGGVDGQLTTYFIPVNVNGTERDDGAGQDVILLGATTFNTLAEGQGLGMFEILTEYDRLAIHGRMVGDRDGEVVLGPEIPAVSLKNSFRANQTAHVQGWERGDNKTTDFGLLNLSSSANSCLFDLLRADGTAVAGAVPLDFQPLSQGQIPDVLSLLNLTNVADLRLVATCDQPFYPYAVVSDSQTGEVSFVAPSVVSIDGLPNPGSGDFVYLSDLNWSGTTNIRNGPHKDRSGWDAHAGEFGFGGYKDIEINGVLYNKGVSWFPGWGNSEVRWTLSSQYQRFQATVRIDDEKTGFYEWGLINRSNGNFIRLQRPAGGFRSVESSTNFRIGGGARIKIYGDGTLLFDSPEFYAYGNSIQVDVDVSGVNILKIELIGTHHEQANAPHRNGLSSTPALVRTCTWHDLLNLADAKLIQ